MSLQYTFYVYINREEDIDRFCNTNDNTKIFDNYNVTQLGGGDGWDGQSDWLSNSFPLNFFPGSPSSSGKQTFLPITQLNQNINTNTEFMTYRTMLISDCDMYIQAPRGYNYSNSNVFYRNVYSEKKSGKSSSRNYYTKSEFKQRISSFPNDCVSTSGIGCKFFSPGLMSYFPDDSNLKQYPLGINLYTTEQNENADSVDADGNKMIGSGLTVNNQNNLMKLYNNIICTREDDWQFNSKGIEFRSSGGKDLLLAGKPVVTCPIHSLRPYNEEPPVSGNVYQTTFTSSNFQHGYYNYGIFSDPTIQIIRAEQEATTLSQSDMLPSALIAVQYNLFPNDLSSPDILPQILDLLSFYNTMYSISSEEFLQPTLTTNYQLESFNFVAYSPNKQGNKDEPIEYGPLYKLESILNNYENNYYQYYVESCNSASRLISDYCLYSNNMATSLCSGADVSYPYLNISQSPCVSDYESCGTAWSNYCSDPAYYNSQACYDYFRNGYIDGVTMSNDRQQDLRKVCSEIYNSTPSSELDDNFYNTCACFLPNSVYQNILENYNLEGQPVGSIQCWYLPCAQSNLPITNPLYINCPTTAFATCIQRSYVNLQTEDADIKNNEIVINQVMEKCSATTFDDERPTEIPTDQPIPPNYENPTFSPSSFSDSTLPSTPFYPFGFVTYTIVGFIACLLVVIFAARFPFS